VFVVPDDLARDPRPGREAADPIDPAFNALAEKGANLMRFDLKAAGIDCRDALGRVFDFHALRDMNGRYTRPRAVDFNATASSPPNLGPGRRAAHESLYQRTPWSIFGHRGPRFFAPNHATGADDEPGG
jgi:hypothetical protein